MWSHVHPTKCLANADYTDLYNTNFLRPTQRNPRLPLFDRQPGWPILPLPFAPRQSRARHSAQRRAACRLADGLTHTDVRTAVPR